MINISAHFTLSSAEKIAYDRSGWPNLRPIKNIYFCKYVSTDQTRIDIRLFSYILGLQFLKWLQDFNVLDEFFPKGPIHQFELATPAILFFSFISKYRMFNHDTSGYMRHIFPLAFLYVK
jgi:hypothetical protein